MSNAQIADVLEHVSELLTVQEASPFRVRAYGRAARTVRELNRPVSELVAENDLTKLEELPLIGCSIARAIRELVHTGRLRMLERLMGELGPEHLFASVPGIGASLAHRIYISLRVETLEELERAAHDGRLSEVRGVGPQRVRAIREMLSSMLRRQRLVGESSGSNGEACPTVAELLAIDAQVSGTSGP